MALRHAAHDGQAQAGAGVVALPTAIEAVEDALTLGRRNARAGIVHLQRRRATFVEDAQLDRAPGGA